MTFPYFRRIPNLEYVDRTKENNRLSQYTEVKNLFKRGKIRDDIFGNLVYFDRYKITGDERPDNVAYKYYDDSTLDWLVLLSNNILNIQTEWPLPQTIFDKVMLEKYGSYEALYSSGYVNGVFYPPHHYETVEIKNTEGMVVLPAGIEVSYTIQYDIDINGNLIQIAVPDFSFTYFDYDLGKEIIVPNSKTSNPVSNYEYESDLENRKRNIFIIKPQYLSLVLDDLDDFMPYKKNAAQYVNSTLKRVDNIRLYE
jgi:hypothetical protein